MLASLLIIYYICSTNLKANHNKDFSVVKTFKVGVTSPFLFNPISSLVSIK